MIFLAVNPYAFEGDRVIGAFETFAAARNAVEEQYKLEEADRRGELGEDVFVDDLYISPNTCIVEYDGFKKGTVWEWDSKFNWIKTQH